MCLLLVYFSGKAGQSLSLNRLCNLQEASNCNIFDHLNLNLCNPQDPGEQAGFHVHASFCPQDGRLYAIFSSLQGLKRTQPFCSFENLNVPISGKSRIEAAWVLQPE